MGPKREQHLRPPLERHHKPAVQQDDLKVTKKKDALPRHRATLERTSQRQDLETPKGRYPSNFSLMDVDIWTNPRARHSKRPRSPSGSSTSATSQIGDRGAALKKRAKRQTKQLVDGAMERTDLTLLEKKAIGDKSHKVYQLELEEFLSFARPRELNVQDANVLDRLVVEYFNKIYLEGFQSYRADRLAAAILHFYPEYGKMGAKNLPRMWRALKGFRKLTPGQSRLAYPMMVWAAMAAELRRKGKLRMALFLLVSLSSYGRPSELIRLQVYCLVRPSPNITSSWTLLMNPEEKAARSKTGEFDCSVALDSPYLLPWAHTLFGYLKQNHPLTPLWDFDYAQYTQAFKDAARALGLDLTPYQARHSGASIDRSRNYRTQLEVQRRGQWRSQTSVMRYEKSARLAATAESLPPNLQAHCRLCEANLGAIMLGYRPSPAFVGKPP
ncbi:unnamed protein product [Effrenium voratum]|nr:unnamed protein product [Effrenium voratum]